MNRPAQLTSTIQGARSRPARRRRRGALTVEFALVSSLVFMIFFASVEFARLNTIMNAASQAAYEGTRRAIVPGATAAQATSAAQSILTRASVNGATITVTPSTITATTDVVTVNVSIPISSNGWVAPMFTNNLVVQRACTLTREKAN